MSVWHRREKVPLRDILPVLTRRRENISGCIIANDLFNPGKSGK